MRPFHEVIVDLRGGRYSLALTEALAEVVKAVQDTGGKGALTMKLTIEQKGDDGALEIGMVCDVKTPRPALGNALMFGDDDGSLSLRNPKQGDMFAGGSSPRLAHTNGD